MEPWTLVQVIIAMSYEDTKEKCAEACKECIEVCIIFAKENKNKPNMTECIKLVNKCQRKCKEVVADGCNDIHLLQDCSQVCDEMVNECAKFDALHSLAIVESCRQCRDICNSFASVSTAL